MSLIRLVHDQASEGPLLITDIDTRLPNEPFGHYLGQPVYVPYNRTFFNNEGLVEVDTSQAGFVDLVPTSRVKLSRDNGVIQGLEANGLLTVVDVPTGALAAPTISAATFDSSGVVGGDGVGSDDDGSVVITGTNFTSFAPDETVVVVRDDSSGETVSLTATQIIADGGSSFSDTSIEIAGSLHGLGAAAGDVESVDVTANKQTATSAVTEV